MSSNQETMRRTVAAANATKQATVAAAVTTFQTTIDASRTATGYTPGFPTNYSTFAAAVATANANLAISRANAEQARQAAVEVAKDTLRGTELAY